ncbi:PIN domain-containing protein [Pedobacter sp. ok626]|nr:PIN domain-containing protein [Pedobacter sp. ok626]
MEIDWNNYAKGSCIMVIAPIVIAEIDKHRRNPKKKIANRAKSITKLFEQIMDHEDSDWILIDKRPTSTTFLENSLEKSEQDDCLLAAILEFSPENSGDQKILVSEDFGPRLKARNLGIKTIKLLDSELLAEEPDENEIRLQKLARENNELKNRVPKVDLFLGGKSKHINFPEFHGTMTFDQYFAQKMEEVKKKYAYHKIPFKMPTQRDLVYQSALAESIMYTESKRYNEDLDWFFENYRHGYLPQLYNWHISRLLSIEIELEIYNEGNVPAENIDLRLRFPKGINIELADTFNPFPLSPIPPEKPLPLDELLMKANKLHDKASAHALSSPSLPKPWISIQKANGLQVDMRCSYLKHHQSSKFGKLAVCFQTVDDMKGFEFEYELMIANDPKLLKGKLQVNFVPTSPRTATSYSKSLDKFLDWPHPL